MTIMNMMRRRKTIKKEVGKVLMTIEMMMEAHLVLNITTQRSSWLLADFSLFLQHDLGQVTIMIMIVMVMVIIISSSLSWSSS